MHVNIQYTQNIGVFIVKNIHLILVRIYDIIIIEGKAIKIHFNHMKAGDKMPLTYKIDILAVLKEKGYSTYRIRKDKLFGEATLQKLRNKETVSWENIEKLCKLLECQPGDIMEYVEEDGTKQGKK